jgi:hypothetical protein
MKLKILLYGKLWTGTHVDCISRVFKQNNINHKIFDLKNNKILEKMILNSYKNIKSNSHSINDRVDEILKILN